MSRIMTPSQQKIAEKLTILNERAQGMLIRIYNIKKMMSNPETKPDFFNDKSIESVIKSIVKKFPNISSSNYASGLGSQKEEITKSLSLYYYTFVDIMDLKDHITDLLTTIDASQIKLDISVNFDLTVNYLELIINYFSIFWIMIQVEDKKAVLGLFNIAHELIHKKMDESFPRLGQMIINYDPPLKKMAEEFVPHAKCLSQALLSLSPLFKRRLQKADEWRSQQFLSLINQPHHIIMPYTSDTIQCEYLSLDLMERWISIGFLLCYQQLQNMECFDLFRTSLHGGFVACLTRDEVINLHQLSISLLDSVKGFGKKVTEIKEIYQTTISNMPLVHKEKRKFLRTSLKELSTFLYDQPGLLGPKAPLVFLALMLARDEVYWLLRHSDNIPQKKNNNKINSEDLNDRQIAELLFYMEELRALLRKYSQVTQRYYIQYLSSTDAPLLDQLINSLPSLSEEDRVILGSIYDNISSLSVKQIEDNEVLDFTPLRLDWFRFQCYSSIGRTHFSLFSCIPLAQLLSTISFHSLMVDKIDHVINQTSDLSLYCFYTTTLEHQFKQCMEFPAQHKFSICFPLICSHFINTTHPLCPEERNSIGLTSIQYAHWFLKEMSEEVNQVISAICDEQCILADKLLPKNAVSIVTNNVNKKKDKKNKQIIINEKPGDESKRKHRENFTRLDKLHMALTELCYSFNHWNLIQVWNHGFVPKEFFLQQLELKFNKSLVGMMIGEEGKGPTKPSELLNNIKAVMSVLQSLENYISIDISKLFINVLPQQTQGVDVFTGNPTICANYTQWYIDLLLKKVGFNGQAIYSTNHKAFISLSAPPTSSSSSSSSSSPSDPINNNHQIEQYINLIELRSLAELIGPYGMKYLGEKLMSCVANYVDDLKKLVIQNKQVLTELRSNFDKPELMKELQKKLTNCDLLLQKMIMIGILLSFRSLAQEALLDVLELRIPFLLSSILDFQQHAPNGQESMIVNEMASAAGLPCHIDPALCAALRQLKPENGEDDYTIACLLMVFIAMAIPRLAKFDVSIFRATYEGHVNNIHCIPKATNSLCCCLFTVLGHSDVEMRLKEFLALTSSSLLRLGQENDKEATKNKESVYLLLDEIIKESPFLTMDLLESCFPYTLLRTAYHHVYKQ